jgi:PEP-CTERM/exosortase A-associated glycosyltransferase
MRVLHVLDCSLPRVAGYTSRSAAIVEHEAALGLEPVVVTSLRQGGGSPASERIGGVLHHRTRPLRAPARARAIPVAREALEMAALGGRILGIHREAPLDLIHAHSPVLCGLPAHAAARRLGLPSVYEIRAFWEDAAHDQGRTGAARYAAVRALETRLAFATDAVVAICDGLRRDLAARGVPEGRIFVVPNGVDPERFAPRPRDEALAERLGFRGKTVIAYIGTLFRFEGVSLLLRALRRLTGARPDVRGLVVGSGEAEAELQAEHARLGLGGAVVLTGRTPPAEVAGLYALADVLCYPRERRRITELTTPLKPLEAMSMGKAVVGSDVGGIRELVREGETGFLFRAGDEVDLEGVLGRLCDDAELRRHAGAAARAEVIRSRSLRTIVGRYREVYAAAAERRARAAA